MSSGPTLMLIGVLAYAAAACGAPCAIVPVSLEGERALDQNSVYDMLQTRDGILWIATLGGLHRYDGLTNEIVDGLDGDRTLDAVRPTALMEDRDGGLWIGGVTGELDRLDIHEGVIDPYSRTLADALGDQARHRISSLAEDGKGRIWIAADTGLFVLDPDTRMVCRQDAVDSLYTVPSRVRVMDDGNVLVGSLWGLQLLDPEGVVLDRLVVRRERDGLPVRVSLQPMTDDSLWLGTTDGRCGSVTAVGGRITYRPIEVPPVIAENRIVKIAGDPAGEVWILCPPKGLYRWDRRTDHVTVLDGCDPRAPRIDLEHIPMLMMDDSGILWIASDGRGLQYVSPSAERFRSASREFGAADLIDDYFWDMVSDGATIYANSRRDIVALDPVTGRVDVIVSNDVTGIWHGFGEILSLSIADDGTLLAGGTKSVMMAVDPETGRYWLHGPIADHTAATGTIGGINHQFVDAEGRHWLFGRGGAMLMPPGLDAVLPLPPGVDDVLGGAHVRVMMEDSAGRYWYGTEADGLRRYDPATGGTLVLDTSTGLPHDGVRGLLEQDGDLWIGTYRGLARIDVAAADGSAPRVDVWTSDDGLPNDTVYDVLPDGEGGVWMSTNDGLARLLPEGGFRTYGPRDGLPCREFNGGAAVRGADGLTVFGGIHGLAWFHDNGLYVNRTPPRAHLAGLESGSRALTLDELERGALVGPVDWRSGSLSFSVASLDFQQPEKNLVAHRIAGLDDDWIVSPAGQRIRLAHLAPGSYVLEYRAANNDGVWGDAGRFSFSVASPPWRSSTAVIIYAVLGAAVIWAVIAAQIGRSRRRAALQAQLAQADKLQAVGQLAGGIAHDFNNYLQVVIGQAELASLDLPEDHPVQASIAEINLAGDRARALATRLLSFSSEQPSVKRLFDASRATDDLRRMLTGLAGTGVDVSFDTDDGDLPVEGDEKQLGQILTNLVLNARDALAGRGRIRVFVRGRELDADEAQPLDVRPGPYVEIAVADDGPGIPPAIREKVFEPFFSTKDVGKGTGLGLSTVHNIARQHGGAATISASLDGGTLVSVYLPVTADRPDAAGPDDDAPRRSAPRGNDETILLADDDDQVRELMAAALERAGYRVHAAVDGRHAVELMKEIGPIDAAVLDVMMPRLNGRQVYDVIRETSLDVPVIFSTGYSADHLAREGIDASLTTILRKPYEPRDLMLALRDALDRRPARV